MNKALVSVIMAAYNAEKYIGEAINSVLSQSYTNWELIIINDGSNDNTKHEISKVRDERIIYFEQENKGVSAARNIGLQHMKGDYFCFLDADDVYTKRSIESRLEIFLQNEKIDFVDGKVIYKNDNLTKTLDYYIPTYEGEPYRKLLKLDRSCLFGPSWMIKYRKGIKYNFHEQMRYAEDLYFYLTISKNRTYSFTTEPILLYRKSSTSAMSNLDGLYKGYQYLYNEVKKFEDVDWIDTFYLKLKITKIMFLTYLFDGKNSFKAIKSIASNITM